MSQPLCSVLIGCLKHRCVPLIRPGFLLDKKIGVNQPKRMENVKILIANTGMDTDKIKVRTPKLLKTFIVKEQQQEVSGDFHNNSSWYFRVKL